MTKTNQHLKKILLIGRTDICKISAPYPMIKDFTCLINNNVSCLFLKCVILSLLKILLIGTSNQFGDCKDGLFHKKLAPERVASFEKNSLSLH